MILYLIRQTSRESQEALLFCFVSVCFSLSSLFSLKHCLLPHCALRMDLIAVIVELQEFSQPWFSCNALNASFCSNRSQVWLDWKQHCQLWTWSVLVLWSNTGKSKANGGRTKWNGSIRLDVLLKPQPKNIVISCFSKKKPWKLFKRHKTKEKSPHRCMLWFRI